MERDGASRKGGEDGSMHWVERGGEAGRRGRGEVRVMNVPFLVLEG